MSLGTGADRLVGHWSLVRYSQAGPDGTAIDVWGADTTGRLSYFPDGRMMVIVAGGGRPRLSGAWAAIPIADKAVAYDRLIAYAGRFTDHGDRVVHHVEIAWIPNWHGKDLERLVIPAGDGRMILRTPASSAVSQDLLWERMG